MKLYYLLDDDDIIEKGDECLFKHSWIEVGEAAIGEKVFDAMLEEKLNLGILCVELNWMVFTVIDVIKC
jgi:hypothetical protein